MTTNSSNQISERHYDPTNDLLFKFVFGNEKHKHITLQFINDVMGLEGDKAFVDLSFKNTEQPPEKRGDKLGRFDVFAITNTEQRINIEMQAVPHIKIYPRKWTRQDEGMRHYIVG